MSSFAKVRNNLLSLAAGEIITKMLGSIMFMVLARYLGPIDFGIYSLGVSFVLILGSLSGLGVDSFIVKEIARDPGKTQILFQNAVGIKIVGSAVAFLSAVVVGFVANYDEKVRIAVTIFSLSIFFSAITTLYDSIFRGFEKMHYSALLRIARSGLSVLIVLGLILTNQSLNAIVSTHVTVGSMLCIFFYFLLRKYTGCKWSLSLDRNAVWALIKGGIPFIATGLVYTINTRADVLLLSKLADLKSVGIYEAANELILVLLIPTSLLSQALYPYLSNRFEHKQSGLGKIINFCMRVIITVGVPVSVGVAALAPKFIHLFYGQKYEESSIVLQIMGVGLSIVFLRSVLGWVLASIEKVNVMMWVNVYSLVVNLILNIILIPRFGFTGAAVATTVSMVFGTLTVLRVIRREVGDIGNVLRLYIKPIISAIPMCVFLLITNSINVFFQVGVGAAIYWIVFFVIKGFSPEDMKILKSAMLASAR